MIYEIRKKIYEEALNQWGDVAQMDMAIEEMSELTKELCKRFRGEDNVRQIAEEIADVTIMLEQMRLLFDVNSEVEMVIDQKCCRLAERLGMIRGGRP